MSVIIAEDPLEGLTLLSRGKVRDVYEVDEHSLLFVASDRISAYDVIMKNVHTLPCLILLSFPFFGNLTSLFFWKSARESSCQIVM